MTWKITETDYREARKRSRDADRSEDEREEYYQLCRMYRGEPFYRDLATRASQNLRQSAP